MKQALVLSAWVHLPALHTSAVQEKPSLAQVAPSARGDQAVVEVAGAHSWHESAGDMSPAAWHPPLMLQKPALSGWEHWPPVQASLVQVNESAVQAVPSVLLANPELDAEVSQTWHSLEGFW